MKSLHLILIGFTFLFIIGCEKDHDRVVYIDRGGQRFDQSTDSRDANDSRYTNYDNDSSYNNENNDEADDSNPQTTICIASLRNNWISNIVFTVNGDTRTVSVGENEEWPPYVGSVTVSSTVFGDPWSETWNDGVDHHYVASGTGKVPDLYSGQ